MAASPKVDEKKLELKLAVTTKFFRALGEPKRLKILKALLEGEKNVTELVKLVGSTQGGVSNHLGCLKQCGFVNMREDGKFVYYSIADENIRQLLYVSDLMITKNAERIWACTRVNASSEDD